MPGHGFYFNLWLIQAILILFLIWTKTSSGGNLSQKTETLLHRKTFTPIFPYQVQKGGSAMFLNFL